MDLVARNAFAPIKLIKAGLNLFFPLSQLKLTKTIVAA